MFGHLLVTLVIWVQTVFRVSHRIIAIEVVNIVHGTSRRVLRRRIGCDARAEALDSVGAGLCPTRRVDRCEAGKDDLHSGILGAHLAEQHVVGGDDLVVGLFADDDVVVAHEEDHNVRGVLVQPAGHVAVLSVVGDEGARVPFVVLVIADNATTVCGALAADKIKVPDAVVAELGLEVGAPAALGGVSEVLFGEKGE